MAKNRSHIFTFIHIYFKKQFTDEKSMDEVFTTIKKQFDSMYKKSKSSKRSDTKSIKLHIPNAYLTAGFERDGFHIMINCLDTSKLLLEIDKVLNKMLMFFNTSEPNVKQTMTSFSKTFEITKDPMMKFINKETITEFSTKIKKSLKPRAIHLTTGIEKTSEMEQEFSVMVSHDEDELELEMTVETRTHGATSLDIMVKSNKTINEYKKNVFSGLGISEK